MFTKVSVICFFLMQISATPMNDGRLLTEDVEVRLIARYIGLAVDGREETLKVTYPTVPNPGQIWKIYRDRSWVVLMNTASSKVLTVAGGCENNGAPTVSPENGTINQRFLLYSDGSIASACNGHVFQIVDSNAKIQFTEKIHCDYSSISNDDFLVKVLR